MAPQPEEINFHEEGGFSRTMIVSANGAVVRKPLMYNDNKEGIYVIADTLGSLEYLLESFKSTGLNVPINAINIVGRVTIEDVLVASLMLPANKHYAAIFALGVRITPEALDYANQIGVNIHSRPPVPDF